ncbi:MAG TPA: hypothetical protein VMF35_12990 [Acidimicrobiales bacterium]|nr:hypothetical protein [Acidimicrobiales bacterium]
MRGRWSIPKALVLIGVLLMVAGVVTVVLGQHLQHECWVPQGRVNGMDVELSVSQCSGYRLDAGVGYLILVAGAGVVLAAALADSPRRRHRRAAGQPRPEESKADRLRAAR